MGISYVQLRHTEGTNGLIQLVDNSHSQWTFRALNVYKTHTLRNKNKFGYRQLFAQGWNGVSAP